MPTKTRRLANRPAKKINGTGASTARSRATVRIEGRYEIGPLNAAVPYEPKTCLPMHGCGLCQYCGNEKGARFSAALAK